MEIIALQISMVLFKEKNRTDVLLSAMTTVEIKVKRPSMCTTKRLA